MSRIMYIVAITIFLSAVHARAEEIYCRYAHNDDVHYGRVVDDTIHQLSAEPWSGGTETGNTVALDQVRLLHPSEPQVIIGLYGSYKDAYAEGTEGPPKSVRWFSKPPLAAASPGDDVVIPPAVDTLNPETEMVVIIGKTVKNATEAEAKEAIFGYTAGNDIVGNQESFHRLHGEPLDKPEVVLLNMLKMGDNFSPYGPFIHRGVDWRNRERTLVVSNLKTGKEVKYSHNTSNLAYTPEKAVSDISRVLTLSPGDVIFTGTTGAPAAQAGDIMTVTVEGLGTLTNRVRVSE